MQLTDKSIILSARRVERHGAKLVFKLEGSMCVSEGKPAEPKPAPRPITQPTDTSKIQAYGSYLAMLMIS